MFDKALIKDSENNSLQRIVRVYCYDWLAPVSSIRLEVSLKNNVSPGYLSARYQLIPTAVCAPTSDFSFPMIVWMLLFPPRRARSTVIYNSGIEKVSLSLLSTKIDGNIYASSYPVQILLAIAFNY